MKVLNYIREKLNNRSADSDIKKDGKSERGSITIFLACILLPLVIAEAYLLNACALISVKQITNDAGKMASNAGLAHYNTTLHNMYGLMAFNPDGGQVDTIVDQTFQNNLNTRDYSSSKWVVSSYGGKDTFDRRSDQISVGSYQRKNRTATVSTEMISGSCLSNTDVFKGQICDAMRYNYKASERIQPGDIEYYSQYPDSVSAIDAKIAYDVELYYLYDDTQALVEKIKDSIPEVSESGEEGTRLISVNTFIYSSYTEIKTLCGKVLDHKSTLEQKKQTWNDANQKAGLSDELRSVMQRAYDEETDDIFDFDYIQELSDVMDDFDPNGEAYKKYLTKDSIEYLEKNVVSSESPISVDEMELAFKDYIESSDKYEKLEKDYEKCDDYDSLKHSWEGNHISTLSFDKSANTTITIDGDDVSDANYTEVFPLDLKYNGNYDYSGNIVTNVNNNMAEIKKTAAFYNNIDGAEDAVENDSVSLLISEYGTEFFGCIHRTDNYTLTGWDMTDTDLNSVLVYTQQEYLIFGNSSARKNVHQMDSMIFYTEYIDNLITIYEENYFYKKPNSPSEESCGYDGKLYPGDQSISTYLRKDIEIMKDAKETANSEYTNVISNWGSTCEGYTYVHFLKLFMLTQVTKEEDVVLSRMRNVIEMNVREVENTHSTIWSYDYSNQNFSFDTAYTAATINAEVRVDNFIGGSTSYEYNTFMMY